MTPGLVLLASYPKSGNTWLRMVLTNLLSEESGPASLRSIIGVRADPMDLFEVYSPWPSGEIGGRQAAALLPDIYQQWSAARGGTRYLKTHLAARVPETGAWLYPAASVRAALVLVRHPFDVAVSMSAHFGWALEKAIGRMVGAREVDPVARRWGGWPEHTRSWTSPELPYPMRLVRYEDLLEDPLAGFSRLLSIAGVPTGRLALERAIAASSFDRLRAEERTAGFSERYPASKTLFFRSGRKGEWRDRLTPALRRGLTDACGEAMSSLGYGPDGEVFASRRAPEPTGVGCHA